jgi:hypothetical protein
LASGTAINAVLAKPVDARKNKPGDTVVAKTTHDVKSEGRVVIPKGSRLVGHVTQANARAKGTSESSLGIVFDRAVLKNGNEVPLNANIQAIAAAQGAANAAMEDPGSLSAGGMGSGAASGGMRTGGGLLGGVGSTAGAAGGAVGNLGGVAGGAVNSTTSAAGSATGALNATSAGVVGIPGLALNSVSSATANGSVLTSTGKNIHLDSGTQMLLKVAGSASQQ